MSTLGVFVRYEKYGTLSLHDNDLKKKQLNLEPKQDRLVINLAI